MSIVNLEGVNYAYPNASISVDTMFRHLQTDTSGGGLTTYVDAYGSEVLLSALEALIAYACQLADEETSSVTNDPCGTIVELVDHHIKSMDVVWCHERDLCFDVIVPLLESDLIQGEFRAQYPDLTVSSYDSLMSRFDIFLSGSIIDESAGVKFDNTCNWENNFDKSINIAQVDIGNGTDSYDECLFILASRAGDPRGVYSDGTWFIGTLEDTGIADSYTEFYADDEDAMSALENFNPSYCGGACGLDNLINADERDNLPEGYAIVRDDSECPCFDGDDLQMTNPDGEIFNVSIQWSGAYRL